MASTETARRVPAAARSAADAAHGRKHLGDVQKDLRRLLEKKERSKKKEEKV